MNKIVLTNKDKTVLLALISILAFIPVELFLSLILFAMVTRGGLSLIKLATIYDSKAKSLHRF